MKENLKNMNQQIYNNILSLSERQYLELSKKRQLIRTIRDLEVAIRTAEHIPKSKHSDLGLKYLYAGLTGFKKQLELCKF